MSTFHAIAGVTALLTDMLNDGLVDLDVDGSGGHTTVSALAPHLVDPPGPNQNHPKQLNLFLYQVTPNQGWHNSNLPSRNSDGQRLTNPPLAIDLHYLLTAYASEYLDTEILLGQAMLLLHENPVLSRDGILHLIANPIGMPSDNNKKARESLTLSELSEQIDGLKITPQYLSTEEVSRLWAALQAPYHPTVAYQVSVVLIESKRRTRASLPVREARVHILPFEHAQIDKVLSKKGTGPALEQPITLDQTLVIRGQHLRGQVTTLRIGGQPVTPTVVGTTEIEAPLAAGLRAGVQTVQVIHDLNFGTPNETHRGFESNAAAFVLRPMITAPPAFANGNPKTVTLTFDPKVGRSQRVSLLLNPLVPVGANTYRFDAPLHNGITTAAQEETTSISFSIKDVPIGKYLVRAQVDGAESPLEFDATTKQYNNPIVEIS